MLWLPENFHFSAERSGLDIRRFTDSTDDEFSLRILTDPLYVCAMLAAERERTLAALSELPELSQVRREVPVSFCETTPFRRIIVLPEGRLLLSRCGRERLLIAAQADSMEAAAELCEVWESRLRRGGEAALR